MKRGKIIWVIILIIFLILIFLLNRRSINELRYSRDLKIDIQCIDNNLDITKEKMPCEDDADCTRQKILEFCFPNTPNCGECLSEETFCKEGSCKLQDKLK